MNQTFDKLLEVLIAELKTIPESSISIMQLLRVHYPHSILTKPITANIIELLDGNIDAVMWLSAMYLRAVTLLGVDNVEFELNKYYNTSITLLSSNANMLLNEDDRSLQHITMADIEDSVAKAVCLKSVHLFALIGISSIAIPV